MKKPIKILLVNDFDLYSGGGGVETYIKELLLYFSENNEFKAELFSASNYSPKRLSGLYTRKYHQALIKKIKQFHPNIVHFHSVTRILSPSVLKLAKKMGLVTVLTAHTFDCVCNRTWGICCDGLPCRNWFGLNCLVHNCPSSGTRWLNIGLNYLRWPFTCYYRRAIKSSIDTIISPSQYLAKAIKKSLGLEPLVIRNFVHLPDTKWSPQKNEILYLGRLAPEKGIETLIKAFKIVKDRFFDARLKIVGSGKATYVNRLKCLAKSLALEGHTDFIGFVKTPQLHYSTANVVAAPSLWLENSPLVVYECFSMNIPVVASRRGGFLELIKDGQRGCLFEPGDYKDLANKLIKILDSQALAKSMHHSSKEYFRTNLSKKAAVEKLTQLYQRLIKC